MTGIEGVGWPTAPRAASRAPGKSGFVVSAGLGEKGQAAAAAASAPVSLDAMLTLQEVGGETVGDREARRHGEDALAALAVLQRALLTGGDEAATLERLADLAASVPRAGDPLLGALVAAIVLRVRVELARRRV
jgi:Class II flagellar assembly regulator